MFSNAASDSVVQLWLYAESREYPGAFVYLGWENLDFGRFILGPLVRRYSSFLGAYGAVWQDNEPWAKYQLVDGNWIFLQRPFNIREAALEVLVNPGASES